MSHLRTSKKSPFRTEFCIVRDYLIFCGLLDNAQRAGCISNLNLVTLRRAEFQDGGSWITSVDEHKTAATSGSAMLSITSNLMDLSYDK